jgi:hypothetical protein
LKIERPCAICSPHHFFSQGGGQTALQYVASGVIDFVAVHCLWNVEVKQVMSVNLCHVVVSTIDMSIASSSCVAIDDIL